MVPLTNAQFEMLQKYAALLDTIEEGFEYIEESFTNYERTQGDEVLADIFDAFARISQTNVHLSHILAEEEEIVRQLELFAGVLEEAYKLEGKLGDQNFKQQVVQNHLSPAFQAWKLSLQQSLKKYIEQ
jgi:inhibitor of KinA sporulation pathway (predicted exonuclease)